MEIVGLNAQKLYANRMNEVARQAFDVLWNRASSNAENDLAHALMDLPEEEFHLLDLPRATWDRREALVRWCDEQVGPMTPVTQR